MARRAAPRRGCRRRRRARPRRARPGRPARTSAAAQPSREQHVGVEAGAGAGVAGRTLLVDLDQQRVAVAVEADLLDPLLWPEVSPLTQYSCRLRLQYVARPVVSVRASASSSIQPSISTSPVSCCCTTAGTSPSAERLRRSAIAGSSEVGHRESMTSQPSSRAVTQHRRGRVEDRLDLPAAEPSHTPATYSRLRPHTRAVCSWATRWNGQLRSSSVAVGHARLVAPAAKASARRRSSDRARGRVPTAEPRALGARHRGRHLGHRLPRLP